MITGQSSTYDAVVIGGGFFGCRIALHLKRYFDSVLVLESESHLLQRASYTNQARVHGGYHYPRSLLTALRSRVNLPEFTSEYEDCIDSQFEKYYAIGRQFSKVSAPQFAEFCRRIGAPIAPAPSSVKAWFNSDFIEDVFTVQEYAFNATKLKQKITQQLADAGIVVILEASAESVSQGQNGLILNYKLGGLSHQVISKKVLNCTYSQINHLNKRSNLPIIPLKHELAEIALVEAPPELRQAGITVMCGPFFSIMPFPARGLHSLSHVRYTPHTEWQDGSNEPPLRNHPQPTSAFPKMLADAQRYIPLLQKTRHVDSLFEVKTVLPQSENDDSRPILFRQDHGMLGYTCLMGGKLDNVYDVLKELDLAYG